MATRNTKNDLTLGEAATALGVSADTLRRWERAGKLRAARDAQGRRRESRRRRSSACPGRPRRHRTGDGLSARNRFPGVVTSVEVGGVMALVEIEAGPHRISAAITRDSVEELGLAPGVPSDGHREGDLRDGGPGQVMRARVLSVLLLCAAVAMLGALRRRPNDKPS